MGKSKNTQTTRERAPFIKRGRSTTLVTDAHGQEAIRVRYLPYGEVEAVAPSALPIPVAYTYTGQEYDGETGLLNYRARMYDPSAGRLREAPEVLWGEGGRRPDGGAVASVSIRSYRWFQWPLLFNLCPSPSEFLTPSSPPERNEQFQSVKSVQSVDAQLPLWFIGVYP